MRLLLTSLFLILSTTIVAQINVSFNYDSKSKELLIAMNNKTGIPYYINPLSIDNYSKTDLSYITFIYKDKFDNILECRERLINDDQEHSSYSSGKILLPNNTNHYIHDINKWCKTNQVFKVEIIIQINAKIISDGKREEANVFKYTKSLVTYW